MEEVNFEEAESPGNENMAVRQHRKSLIIRRGKPNGPFFYGGFYEPEKS